MANIRDIIVFDFETGGANPHTCQPTQIAAVAIHSKKLELLPGGEKKYAEPLADGEEIERQTEFEVINNDVLQNFKGEQDCPF